eukprot:RCo013965
MDTVVELSTSQIRMFQPTCDSETLEQAFRANAEQGVVPIERVGHVLRELGLELPDVVVRNSVEALFGRNLTELEAEGLSQEELRMVFGSLARDDALKEGRMSTELPKKPRRDPVAELCGRIRSQFKKCKCKRGEETVGGHLKPTTRLLLVIVVMSLLIASTVAG